MLETSARLLRLLSLFQSRRDWTGTELAGRIGVTTRTVRNDVERLRQLGYQVDGTQGATGGYRLGTSAVIPPLPRRFLALLRLSRLSEVTHGRRDKRTCSSEHDNHPECS